MLPENKSSPASRFLHVDSIFSNVSVARLRETVISRWQEKYDAYKPAFEQFLQWKPADNEVVVFTMYAYADIELPKQFDCIFELENPTNVVQADLTIPLAVYEGWLPMLGIEHGCKHACILRFKHQVPSLLDLLPEEEQHRHNYRLKPKMLGICNYQNYEEIAREFQRQLKLKELYGTDWLEHLDDEGERTT